MEIALNPRGNRYKCVGSDLDRSPLALLYKASGAIVPPVCFDNEGKVLVIMVFSSKWRARAVASLALAVALAVVNGTSVLADSWNGTRSNGNACNGYFLARSVYEYGSGYPEAFRAGIQAWYGSLSSTVSAGMFERSSWLPRTDKFFVGETLDNTMGALTCYYTGTSSNNLTRTLDHDLNWYVCTIAMYPGNIQAAAGGDADFEMRLQTKIATHEIGHSLKFAHPKKGQGTFRDDKPLGAGRRSIMEQQAEFPDGFVLDGLQAYDVNELIAKWGQ